MIAVRMHFWLKFAEKTFFSTFRVKSAGDNLENDVTHSKGSSKMSQK